jgi:hypothetical protein
MMNRQQNDFQELTRTNRENRGGVDVEVTALANANNCHQNRW